MDLLVSELRGLKDSATKTQNLGHKLETLETEV